MFFTMVMPEASGQTASLRGSPSAIYRKARQARIHKFTHLRTANEIRRFVNLKLLVRVPGNANYIVRKVSFPYARPEVKLFIERISRQYQNYCSEKLVITSLTRPLNRQPRNASPKSVHPTGMAVDFRISNRTPCRQWLEKTLLSLENKGVIEATKERRPRHYDIAVFPRQYSKYLKSLVAR